MPYENTMKFKFQYLLSFIRVQPSPFIYTLSLATFEQEGRAWEVVTETLYPTQQKVFIDLLQIICQHLVCNINLQ